MVNVSVNIMQSLPVYQKLPQHLNGNALPYKMTLTHVTFAALWLHSSIDKDRYYNLKFCSDGSNQSKYVSSEKYMAK